jgi:hypothetical protein
MTFTLTPPPMYKIIRTVATATPGVFAHLKGLARWIAAKPEAYKTYDFYLSTLTRMIRNVYDGYLAGEFIDIMASLINGQINQAYKQAWDDVGTGSDGDPEPSYLTQAAEDMVVAQYDFVDGFFRDIVAARLDKTPIEPLLARAPLWANRWNEAYNDAVHLIQLELGGKEVWIEGDTVDKCPTCLALNGIVAFAHEWESAGFHPQGGPNPMLDCGGYNCQCRLEPTDARRSPRALETLMNIATARGMG